MSRAYGVVPVAEAIPLRLRGLDVAGGIPRPAAKNTRPGTAQLLFDRPAHPCAAGLGSEHLRTMPLSAVGLACIDASDGGVAGPCTSRDSGAAGLDRASGHGIDNQGLDAHPRHRRGAAPILVDVALGLDVSIER